VKSWAWIDQGDRFHGFLCLFNIFIHNIGFLRLNKNDEIHIMGCPHYISGPGSCVYSYEEEEEEECFIDQLRTHKGHSNYND
jgi:hypothetical protein